MDKKPEPSEATYVPSFDLHATNRPVQAIPVNHSLVDPSLPAEAQQKLQDIQGKLVQFKDKLLTKFEGYISGVALLPPQQKGEGKDAKLDTDTINVLVLIDDTDSTTMTKEELKDKLAKVIVTIAKDVDHHLHPEVLLYSEVWQHCYDSKYDILQMIAMSAPVYDNGMLSAIKIAEIHKTMVLKKFEKYIVSYVLAGSLVQGKATPTSDIDVFIVIDDTDVKKMTRFELKEKLRAIILNMAFEAGEITGVKNKMNIQTYILTDFWDSIKEAQPVIFTFLRDGVPFFDRGIFMPWKQLLRMGRIRPSMEAIDIYMSSGEQALDRVKAKLKEIGMEDFFWALLTPSQAVLMLNGVPPPTPKETPGILRDVFVVKEKMLEEKYVKILEKVISIRKELEHGTRTTFTGKELDVLQTEAGDYLKRITELASQIEKRNEEKTVVHMYDSLVTILRDILRLEHVKDVAEADLPARIEEHIVGKGYLPQKYNRMIGNIFKAKHDFEKGSLNKVDIEQVRKESAELTKVLIEFIQRKRGYELERSRIVVKHGAKYGEVLLLDGMAFIIYDIDAKEREIVKAPLHKDGVLGPTVECTIDEFEKAIAEAKIPPQTFIREKIFENLKHIFGKDVEIQLRR